MIFACVCIRSPQVAERAVEVHGSKDQIEKEKQKKLERRELAQQKKFDKNVQGRLLTFFSSKISMNSFFSERL